jgi:hypothetical protein
MTPKVYVCARACVPAMSGGLDTLLDVSVSPGKFY